jgi:glycosyltransferase involved in cell wall biosynthesis
VTQLQSRSGGPDEAAGQARWRPGVALVLATSAGGIGAHVRDLAHRLARAGALVTVCGPEATNDQFRFDDWPDPGGDTRDGAVRFLAVEISTGAHPSDARAVTALRRVLSHAQPDVVHAHGLRAGLVAVLAGRGRPGRAPLVVTLHNAVISRGLRGGASRLVERMVVRGADVVLGASADLVARADETGARDARLGPVSAPMLPPAKRTGAAVRAELGVAADTPLILSVGRLHPQKGYDVLVEAAARWRDLRPCPLVVIAGDGPSYLGLTARISALRAPVALLGHRSDVADLLAAADLAVVSSIWEARQLFTQEALRAGVPLVATAVGGLPDLVGQAAVLVPPGDPDALDRAVRDLLDDPELRARYARHGRDRAATWPTGEQTLAQVWSLYEELARRPPGGST